MKIKNMARTIVSAAALVIFLNGCGSSSDPLSSSEALDYLHERYSGYFHITDEEEVTKPTYAPRVDENGSTYTYARERSDYHYSFADSNDISFSLSCNYQTYGCSGHGYEITDNYCWKWLLAHEDIYKPLMNSGLDCAVIRTNELSSMRQNNGFRLYVQEFDDLDKAVDLICSVVNSDDALLPDNDTENFGPFYDAVPCHISIVTPEETELIDVSFRTAGKSEKHDPELMKYCLKNSFVKYAHNNGKYTVLPDDWKSEHLVDEIWVSSDNKGIGVTLERNQGFYYELKCYNTGNDNLWLGPLADLCEAAGYKVKNKGKMQMKFTKGKDTVIVGCPKKGFLFFSSYDEPVIIKNGKEYKPNGYFRGRNSSYSISLTCSDLRELFGIEFDFNIDEKTANMSVK